MPSTPRRARRCVASNARDAASARGVSCASHVGMTQVALHAARWQPTRGFYRQERGAGALAAVVARRVTSSRPRTHAPHSHRSPSRSWTRRRFRSRTWARRSRRRWAPPRDCRGASRRRALPPLRRIATRRRASPWEPPLGAADLHHEGRQARQRRQAVRGARVAHEGSRVGWRLGCPIRGRAQPRRGRDVDVSPFLSHVQIFIVLELITGGELFDKIVAEGRCVRLSAAREGERESGRMLPVGALTVCLRNRSSPHRTAPPAALMKTRRGTTSASSSRALSTATARVRAPLPRLRGGGGGSGASASRCWTLS